MNRQLSSLQRTKKVIKKCRSTRERLLTWYPPPQFFCQQQWCIHTPNGLTTHENPLQTILFSAMRILQHPTRSIANMQIFVVLKWLLLFSKLMQQFESQQREIIARPWSFLILASVALAESAGQADRQTRGCTQTLRSCNSLSKCKFAKAHDSQQTIIIFFIPSFSLPLPLRNHIKLLSEKTQYWNTWDCLVMAEMNVVVPKVEEAITRSNGD